ncbi:MAG: nucleotidyltransferase family protein [Actinomycetota bacterium]
MKVQSERRLIGIVPAAGYAARLPGLRCSKEALPVGGRPVIEHLLERMSIAGCSDIRVVTRPEKVDVIGIATRWGSKVVLARPPDVSASLLAGCDGARSNDVILFGFPDTVWEPLDGFRRLVAAMTDSIHVVLGLFRWDEADRGDVVRLDPSGAIAGIEIKPPHPSSSLIWGCAALRADQLRTFRAGIEPGDRFEQMNKQGILTGIRLSDDFTDIGSPGTYSAFVDSPRSFRDPADIGGK